MTPKVTTVNYYCFSATNVIKNNGITKPRCYRGSDMGGGVGGINYAEFADGTDLNYKFYNLRGDVVMTLGSDGAVKSASYYHAFGKHDDRLGGIATDKHRANTKVEDDDGLLNEGKRFRSLEYAIFLTPDPLEYQDGLNFYLYCGQNPWGRFDPLGLKLHMLYYTKGNPDGGDESFEAAAKTRKESIESSKNFDKEKDKEIGRAHV